MNPNNLEGVTLRTPAARDRAVRPGASWVPAFSDFEPIGFGGAVGTSEVDTALDYADELRQEGLPDTVIREIMERRRAQMAQQGGRIARFSRTNTFNMSDVEETLKVRHLSRDERRSLHQPLPDWKESPKGDVCKNACTLEVDDIIGKHLVNA